jgi:hypothetical protein
MQHEFRGLLHADYAEALSNCFTNKGVTISHEFTGGSQTGAGLTNKSNGLLSSTQFADDIGSAKDHGTINLNEFFQTSRTAKNTQNNLGTCLNNFMTVSANDTERASLPVE